MNEIVQKGCPMVVILENGALDGGFGEKIARFYGECCVKVLYFGMPEKFVIIFP